MVCNKKPDYDCKGNKGVQVNISEKLKVVPKKVTPETVQIVLERVKYIFSQGEINEDQYRFAVHCLTAGDIEGNLWTVGTETGKWYRKDGDEWIQDDPPGVLIWAVPEAELKKLEAEELEILRMSEKEGGTATLKCSGCGQELPPDSKFCNGCGKQV
jgi:hypothetical protein